MACKNLDLIINELQEAAQEVDESQVNAFADAIIAAKRVFVAGKGRSGCAAQAFTNRLLHLGFTVYWVGDITTPPIGEGDLFVIGSGSGKTASLVTLAKIAKANKATIATVTISPESPIGEMAELSLKLPGSTRLLGGGTRESIQPMGSQFEQLSWLAYDSVVLAIMKKTHQTNEDLVARHGNLE